MPVSSIQALVIPAPGAPAVAPYWKCAVEVPFLLGHGQTIGRLIYERLSEAPDRLYGTGLGSNYQAQTLKLSKHFRAFSL